MKEGVKDVCIFCMLVELQNTVRITLIPFRVVGCEVYVS
jgi:hypothetical protein